MDIIVCVKKVPDTREAELIITKDGKDIEKGELVCDINEWDRYAVEEAIRLKEELGGSVTAVAVTPDEDEDLLRKCLAMGADRAIMVKDESFRGSDAHVIATALHHIIKDLPFDLVFTGVQAEDDGYAQVGGILAGFLKVPHATLVTQIEVLERKVQVHRELEEALMEVVELDMPAVCTIQTGINEPRYVSIMGIRKAAKKEMKTLNTSDLGLTEEELGDSASKVKIKGLSLPPSGKGAEILKGSTGEIATKVASILKSKGVLA